MKNKITLALAITRTVPKANHLSAVTALIFSVTAVWPGSAAAAGDPVSDWNVIAVQATLTAGENAVVSSRTLAIVQVAIHDALNAIDPRDERYAFTGDAPIGASVDAAIATAARDSIVGAIAVGALPFAGFGTPALHARPAPKAGINPQILLRRQTF
jgi:hypothetical protein